MTPQPAYKRVLLKISGESFCPPGAFGVHREPLDRMAREIAEIAEMGVQTAVVCGGGNYLRGARYAEELGIEAATADYMGMLGTVLNGLVLQDAIQRQGREARVQSALDIDRVCEPFDRHTCLRHLDEGRVVILAAGTGNPHVTTDSCAAIRGIELRADVLLKGTKVDGVYSDDPVKNPAATFFEHVTYDQVIQGRLKVMDLAATALCEEHKLPVVVFNLFKPGVVRRIVLGEHLGTRMDLGA